MKQVFIIAEAGVNHNGSLFLAKKLVDEAKKAGVDAIKFQTFKAENIVTKKAIQADYQKKNSGEITSQYCMLKKLELSFEDFKILKEYCDEKEILFLSTPFDFESVDFLVDELKMSLVKISSGDLTNLPLLHHVAKKRKKIIISTGMATIEEIHDALAFIAFGLKYTDEEVVYDKVYRFYNSQEAKKILKKYVSILHCTTEYPTPVDSINLNAINMMRDIFKLDIGFSDHSIGINIPVAAVAMGAVIIEKHFTLDKNLQGPDHVASLSSGELKEMVRAIRDVEMAKGEYVKKPVSIEIKNKNIARKSLIANTDILEGEEFTLKNLAIKRPGGGISPKEYWHYLNKKSKKNYRQDEYIDE